ncbi:MAG TPA: hypothetical protein DCS93_23365 [Microscillaceae bacterium]|nr:hypothetical protein [Microscillaceae bacterium]
MKTIATHDSSSNPNAEINIAKEHALLQEKLWIDSTLTQFDDVLRENYDKSLGDFSEAIISHLATLTKAIRGAFFTVKGDEEERRFLEATGGFACVPDTMAKKTFRMGEDLIGQVAKTKKVSYMDNLPMQNLTLNVAAGSLSAGSIIILPLVFNDEVYGVIELVFIQNLANKYQDLLPRLGNNIASMLQSIQNNIRTKKLLNETQEQAEALRAQEEELRQNLEELAATQDAMQKKQTEIENMNHTLAKKEKVLEKALQEAQAKETELANVNEQISTLHVLVESSQDFIAYAHLDGRGIFINKGGRKLMGVALDADVSKLNIKDFYPDTSWESFQEKDMPQLLKEGSVTSETRLRNLKTGTIIEVSMASFLIKDQETNEPKFMATITKDITDRKAQEMELVNANEELRAQEEELRQNLEELSATQDSLMKIKDELAAEAERSKVLFETSRDAIVVMDKNGIFTDVNEAAVKIFGGIKKEQLLGKTPMDCSPETQSLHGGKTSEEVATQIMEATMKTGTYTHEWHFKKLNTEIFEAEVKLVSFELQGNPYMQFVVRDITDKKAKEREILKANEGLKTQKEELKQHLQELRATQDSLVKLKDELTAEAERSQVLFETSRDAIVVMDKNGIFTDVNEAAVKIFGGIKKEQLLGKTPMDCSPETQSLHGGKTSEEVATQIMEATMKTGTYTHEWHFKKLNTEIFEAEVKLVSFELQGNPYMQFVVRDITAHKQQIRDLETQLAACKATLKKQA